MSQVDAVIDRLRREIARPRRRLAECARSGPARRSARRTPSGSARAGRPSATTSAPSRRSGGPDVASVEVRRTVATPLDAVWDTLTDFGAYGRWIPLTPMRTDPPPVRLGWGFGGFTGVGPVGFLDSMLVVRWEPPADGAAAVRGPQDRPGARAGGPTSDEPPPTTAGTDVVWREEIVPRPEPLGRLAAPATDRVTERLFADALDADAPGGRHPGDVVVTEHLPDGLLRRPRRRAPAAPGPGRHRSTSPTTTTSGASRSTASRRCSNGSPSRPSSPGSPGSPSCASARPSEPPSPASTPSGVAAFDETDRARLLADAGIVRNVRKVDAAITNARAVLELRAEGGLDALRLVLRSRGPPAPAHARRTCAPPAPSRSRSPRTLKQRGFVFVGPTTAYAAMQACGLVDDHLAGCFRAR